MRSGGKILLTPIIPVLLYHGSAGGVVESLSRYLFETGELSANEFIGKIELLVHHGRIREGLLTTAEQLRKMGFEEGEEIGIRKGEERGLRKGEEAGRRELVMSMFKRGMTAPDIARATGLSVEKIEALLNETT